MPKKILIADDSQFYRKVIGDLLKEAGYEVTITTDGRKALDLLRRDRVDLIISDILMPNMDGYSLTREIQRDSQLRKIPIILCSGTHSAQKYEDLAINLGAVSFIPKDASSQEWLETIKTVIKGEVKPDRHQAEEPAVEMTLYNRTLIQELEERCLTLERENKRLTKLLQGLTGGMERLISECRSAS